MKLLKLIQDFDGLDDVEKLELLTDLSDELPPVSRARASDPSWESCRVHECMTPVYLWVELADGVVHLAADVPKQSPTVRGLVALMVRGLTGASPSEVETVPDDMVIHLGLQKALGMQRQQGFRGVVARIKGEVRRQFGAT